MKEIRKLILFLLLGKKYITKSQQEIAKLLFLATANLLGIIIISIYVAINIYVGDIPIAVMEFFLVIVLLLALFMIRTSTSLNLAIFFGTTVAFIISIHNFYSGGFASTGLYWVYIFPAIIFFIQGRKNGVIWFWVFYVTLVFLTFMDIYYTDFEILPYEPFHIAMFLVSFLTVGLIIYFYQLYQEYTQSLLITQTSKLKTTNDELQHSIIKRQHTEEKSTELINKVTAQNQELETTRKATLSLLEDIEEEKEKNKIDKEQLEVILNSIGDGVVVVDNNKIITSVNPAFEQLTGFMSADIKNKKFDNTIKLYDDEAAKKKSNFIDEVFKTHTLVRSSLKSVLKDANGEALPVETIATPIFDQEDNILGSVIILRDTSKEREIDKMKSEFVSVASHQLKTPLTGAIWTTELLESEDNGMLNKKQQKLAVALKDAHKKMLDLVNELLNVSRIDRGEKFDIIKTNENLVSVAKVALISVEKLAKRKKMKLNFETSDEVIEIKIDVHKIEEMIINLLNNAIKYSEDNKNVWLALSKTKTKAKIKVRDEGIGIPVQQQDQIFKKFFRAKNASESEEEGTGLGLYIAQAVAHGHGGEITFESEEGKGSEFVVQLPLNSN